MTMISDALATQLDGLQKKVLTIGLVLLVAGLAIALITGDMAQFYQSYLIGFVICFGITCCCWGFCMLHHLVGGRWGFIVQRLLESVMSTFPVLLILFVPIVIGMHDLYHWTHEEAVQNDIILQHKQSYLNTSFFIVRALLYFAIWIAASHLLIKWSNTQDVNGDPTLTDRIRDISGPGIVVFALSMTFASFDWIMSTDPHWFSTLYGVMMIVDAGGAAMALIIMMMTYMRHHDPYSRLVGADRFHDWGKLQLAFTLLWFYMMLSQFLIIWAANLPEENPWYIHRTHNGWEVVTVALVLCRFVIAFFLLLSIPRKRDPRRLVKVAIFIFVMHWVDMYWHIAPNFHGEGFHFSPLDFIVPAGLVGVWFFFVLRRLKTCPLIPQKDPRFGHLVESASTAQAS
ncbi:MAG: hypothetical protein FJY97_06785 [candidate division Zixibacteria bacterium]|nr:hypothetical protein [candidate division Zixibacteria bacterium]